MNSDNYFTYLLNMFRIMWLKREIVKKESSLKCCVQFKSTKIVWLKNINKSVFDCLKDVCQCLCCWRRCCWANNSIDRSTAKSEITGVYILSLFKACELFLNPNEGVIDIALMNFAICAFEYLDYFFKHVRLKKYE